MSLSSLKRSRTQNHYQRRGGTLGGVIGEALISASNGGRMEWHWGGEGTNGEGGKKIEFARVCFFETYGTGQKSLVFIKGETQNREGKKASGEEAGKREGGT